MQKLFFTVATFILTFGVLAVACTKVGGPPRPESTLQLVSQNHGSGVEQAEVEPAREATPEESAADKADTQAKGVRFAVISDLNSSYGSVDYNDEVHQAVSWLVDEVAPDAVISTGDMVAGQRQGLDYEAMWRGFHAAVTRPLARAGIPFMVTPGNHDASAGSVYLEERITFVEQWKQNRPEVNFVDDTFYPLHYAFEIGPALFISLDATITGPIDAEQRRWLEDVLEANAHKKAKIVFGHIPLHPFSEERKTEILADEALETLLADHNVDLMISGHHHAYYPGRRDDLRMVSMACLGSGPRTLIGTEQKSKKSVAVIDITPEGDVTLDAYDALDHAKIERNTLPKHLNDGDQRIWRDDTAPPTTN
jgi:3',5'-cyclic AMP phosphodiesterase CpdA